MKKLLILLLLLVVGCETPLEHKSNRLINESDDFDFVVDSSKQTDISLKYVITNNSDEVIDYTEEYYIEKLQDNEWYMYDVEVEFIDKVTMIYPGKEEVRYIEFEPIYGKLKKGEYRFIKVINGKKYAALFKINS